MKIKFKTGVSALAPLVLLLSCLGTAQAQVKVNDAWARATVAQQKATGAFMQITAAQDSRLVEVRSPRPPRSNCIKWK